MPRPPFDRGICQRPFPYPRPHIPEVTEVIGDWRYAEYSERSNAPIQLRQLSATNGVRRDTIQTIPVANPPKLHTE